MEDDFRTGTPYRISCLRQQPSGVDRRCQIWPIRGYTRFWYTVRRFLKLISQAFARRLPQSPLVFSPFFRSLSFSLALHYLNAWNRLPKKPCSSFKLIFFFKVTRGYLSNLASPQFEFYVSMFGFCDSVFCFVLLFCILCLFSILCFCFGFCVSGFGFGIVFSILCFRFGFCVSVLYFVILFCVSVFGFCVSVLHFVILFSILCFCFEFCDSVLYLCFCFQVLCFCFAFCDSVFYFVLLCCIK